MEFKEEQGYLLGGGKGGLKYLPEDRMLAEKYRVNRKICRKCYARLSNGAHNCRNKRCGHCADIRQKKKFIAGAGNQ